MHLVSWSLVLGTVAMMRIWTKKVQSPDKEVGALLYAGTGSTTFSFVSAIERRFTARRQMRSLFLCLRHLSSELETFLELRNFGSRALPRWTIGTLSIEPKTKVLEPAGDFWYYRKVPS